MNSAITIYKDGQRTYGQYIYKPTKQNSKTKWSINKDELTTVSGVKHAF